MLSLNIACENHEILCIRVFTTLCLVMIELSDYSVNVWLHY